MMTWQSAYFLVHGWKPARRSPRRWSPRKPARNHHYRAWIRTLPCAVCGIEGHGLVEAAHTGSDGGTSMKASDYSCIPLCHAHHRRGPDSYHDGKETFEQVHGINCREIARKLNRLWFKYSDEVK